MSNLNYQPGNRRYMQAPGGTSTIMLGTDTDQFAGRKPSKKPVAQEQPQQYVETVEEVQAPDYMDIDEPEEEDIAQTEVTPEMRDQVLHQVQNASNVGDMVSALHGGLNNVSKQVEGKGQTTGTVKNFQRRIKVPMDDPIDRKTQKALDKLRTYLKKRGSHGIIGLGKKFKSMDDNGNKQLEFEEFKKAMSEMSFEQGEIDAMFRFMDFSCDGSVDFDEFLEVVKGPMNKERQQLVMKAFKVLDKTGDGKVTVDDLQDRYDVKKHPDYIAGVKSRDEILSEFLSNFERANEPDGIVSPAEFLRYYNQISASIDDDDYFELMIRNVWHISGGEGWAANTTCRRVLVTHEDGTMSVQEVTDDFDVGSDPQAIKQKLEKQGVSVKKISMYGSMEDSSQKDVDDSSKSKATAKDAKQKNLGSSIVF